MKMRYTANGYNSLTIRIALIVLAACPLGSSSSGSEGLRLADILDPLPVLDDSIPSPQESMNLAIGERHWYHYEVYKYLDTLAEASPKMVRLGEHARSYGGRLLVSYVISSPANLERLEEIKNARQQIIDPAGQIDLADTPAILHMGYGVHGNEPSATNVTPLLAYYLAASQDPKLEEQLEKVVILFNPIFNPDGFDRFAHWTNSLRGAQPSSDQNDLEHNEPFVSGRTNYYWFDLNRDWLPHQHPESQGRLQLFHQWKPNVQLDFHEQGTNSSYFFMPGKPERVNPLTPPINQELTDAIAAYHRAKFDAEGTLYYSRERYDDFYMGKGSTYPDLFGCVGILFEQASSRGAKQSTPNGLLTFALSIANQFKMSLTSLAATADLKDSLLSYQRNFYIDSKKTAAKGGYYLATAEGDLTRLQEFVRVLQGHQIEVELLAEAKEIDGQVFPAETSIAIPLDQTQHMYLQALWERRTEFQEDIFYDVSAWTLPLSFNLKHTHEPVKKAATKALPPTFLAPKKKSDWRESSIGYLIDWRDSAAPALLYSLLEEEANVRVAEKPFSARLANGEDRKFGYGTLLVAKALDAKIPDAAVSLLEAAHAKGLPVYPVASSSTRSGIDLGSREFTVLEKPKVILVTGPGISQYDAGEIWHLFDQRIRMPITMIEWTRLRSIDLSSYTHILLTADLPGLSESTVGKIDDFVRQGGVLWAQESKSVEWAIDQGIAEGEWRLTEEEKTRQAQKKAKEKGEPVDRDSIPERQPYSTSDDQIALKKINGSIFNTLIDITHPIGYGYASPNLPVMRNTAKALERSLNPYSTPVQYTDAPLLAGYASDENIELIANSASLIVNEKGKGAVVLSVDNPSFRAFWWGTQRLLINAVFFGKLLEEPE